MITRQNFNDVLNSISAKDKNRILNSSKEYVVILLHIFNAGSVTEVILTNNFVKYQNVSNDGNCILELTEVQNLLS